MSEGIHVSPSQVKVWRRCKRKWAFKYIDHIKEPSSIKQQFGTNGHTCMEEWIKHGTIPPDTEVGNVARQLIRTDYIPAPSPALAQYVEKEIKIPWEHIYPSAMVRGYSDLIVPGSPPTIIDYKFTSSLRWAMSNESAERDPQALIYGRYCMDLFNTDRVNVRFLYASASNPTAGARRPTGTKKVEVSFDRHEDPFSSGWDSIEKDVSDIMDAKLNWENANENAPFDTSACKDFGGCPFLGKCSRPVGSSIAAIVGKIQLSQRDDCDMVKQLTNSLAQTKKDAPVSLLDKIRRANVTTEEPSKKPVLDRLKILNEEENVNPPPVKPVFSDETPAYGTDVSDLDQIYKLNSCTVKELRSRAKAAGIKGLSVAPKTELVAALMARPATPETETKTNGAQLMVLFDCAPRKNAGGIDVENLSDWIYAVTKKVADDNEVSHWGLIEFGKGAPALSAALDASFKEKPPKGCVVVDSYSLEGKAVKDVLIRYADVVIQGVR